MKRPRRIILNAPTVLSLLLCGATVVLWVRSYWREDDVTVRPVGWDYIEIISSRGSVAIHRRHKMGSVNFRPRAYWDVEELN